MCREPYDSLRTADLSRARRKEGATARGTAETVACRSAVPLLHAKCCRRAMIRPRLARTRDSMTRTLSLLSTLVLTYGLLDATRFLHSRCRLVASLREMPIGPRPGKTGR